MTTRMLIDARHPEETRVVVVKGNRIEEFDFEAAARKQIKGNIYLAKVTRVEPSLQAAFVDYGGNRHGFLAFSEIHPDYYQIPREDREALLREERELAEEHAEREEDRADDSAHADADNGADNGDNGGDNRGDGGENGEGAPRPEEGGSGDEASAEALRRKRMSLRRRYKIQEVIRRRQVMLVQVVKEERGNKGAALTTYLSLAGRYSVLMPNTAHGGGISRKIANVADRKRLKQIMAELNLPTSMGAIVRTAGLERTRTEIKRDFDYLTRLWDEIRTGTLSSTAPALIYEDSDLIKRAIRDIYTREIDEVLVDGDAGYKQAKDFMRLLMPSHAKKVQPYNDPVPLFQRAAVEGQLAALMNPVVTLKSGGYIVINSTEALVAVDVNSGRSTREYNIEETATKTNIEAAEEVARQLRLRDLAGLVVVDFIDMESNSNNRKVERALKDALKQDRARIQVGRISAFGLLEMSRQRLRTGVLEASTETCPTCEGTGLVRTPGSAALAALRLLEEEAVRGRASLLRLRADRPVAVYMLNRKRRPLAELEERYGVHIEVVPDDALTGAKLTLEPSGPPPAHAPVHTALPPVVSAPVEDEADEIDEEDVEESADAAAGTDSERRGRRRRRGGRNRSRDGRTADADSADAGSEDGGSEDADNDEGDDAVAASSAAEPSDDAAQPEGEATARRRRPRRRGGRNRRRDGQEANGDSIDSDDNGHEDGVADESGEAADAPAAEAAPAEVDPTPAAEAPAAEAPVAEAPAIEAPAEVDVEAVTNAQTVVDAAADTPAAEEPAAAPVAEAAAAPEAEAPAAPKRRRTVRKVAPKAAAPEADLTLAAAEAVADAVLPEAVEPPAKPVRRRRTTKAAAEAAAAEAPAATAEAPAEEAKPKPRRTTRRKAATPAAEAETPPAEDAAPAEAAPAAQPAAEPPAAEPTAAAVAAPAADTPATTEAADGDDTAPPRRGWWQRTFGN